MLDYFMRTLKYSQIFANFAHVMSNPLKQLAGETAIYGLSTILARIINFLFVR